MALVLPRSQDRFNFCVFGGNAVWFGLATYYFIIKAPEFVARHVPREVRRLSPSSFLPSSPPPLHRPIIYTSRFLGGMNSALVLLSLFRFRRIAHKLSHKQQYNLSPTSKEGRERERERERETEYERETLIVSSLGHFSQFFFNIAPFWEVFTGVGWGAREKANTPFRMTWEMLFIFVVDGAMALLNAYAAYKLE